MRPAPDPVPLLVRTTPRWAPATPHAGMRVPLREVATPGDTLRAMVLGVTERSSLVDDAEFELPPTPWRALHSRPDLVSASSEHGNDVPGSNKAKARRLAAMINQLPRSRAHGNNAPLSRLATAN